MFGVCVYACVRACMCVCVHACMCGEKREERGSLLRIGLLVQDGGHTALFVDRQFFGMKDGQFHLSSHN